MDYEEEKKAHRGALILGLGIFGFFCCGFAGIAAFVMGRQDVAEMKAEIMDESGMGLTQAGMWIGLIGFFVNMAVGIGTQVVGNM
jgi:hypothetical protein